MVRVKGGEWGHVLVVKEPAKHGMAWHVKCTHCGKVFQGNAMRIRSHLLGHPEKVSGCPACPAEAREELRLSYLAKSQVERKNRQNRSFKASRTSHQRRKDAQQGDPMLDPKHTEEKLAVEQALRNMAFQAGLPVNYVNHSAIKSTVSDTGDLADLDFFLDGFGIRAETIGKIKEMGFTGKTFMSNVDELLTLLDSIKQHCHLTLGEEWGIKGAAKKWQKGHGIINSQTELEKWPDPEFKSAPGCKEEVLSLP
ncbi:uncharacterized protein [Physcomitrium patens]|uniref:Floricaula/leafy-like transcription factor n=1 Tax=Physcomitrium patens TaxID=3218 RepID=A0A2K1IVN0_PHYPA|nr:uncharacterized protein LOC112273240 [Physcomitrium patens]PNR33330.1 hypothetical protein PHYPA_025273 [Physcomitrium patens]|eukprot:XP_024357504.1 uncharacterized protein LOC112273240 [Physcomitrella patens]